MTIKDKLAHYEPKPLGEKGRYAVLLPLIFVVFFVLFFFFNFVCFEHMM